jgi:copper chaperone
MATERFVVANVKCQGCVSTIREGLLSLDGVATVEVDIATREVTVEGQALSRRNLSETLRALGYPEVGTPAGR